MSFAAVVELVTLVAYCVVLLGGKQKRETGWKVLAFMLILVGVVQCASMAIVVGDFDSKLVSILLIICRPTYLITMINFPWGGSWTNLGSFAQSAGALLYFRLASSHSQLIYSLQKVAMSSFPVSVTADDH
jgi:hypothetical protein